MSDTILDYVLSRMVREFPDEFRRALKRSPSLYKYEQKFANLVSQKTPHIEKFLFALAGDCAKSLHSVLQPVFNEDNLRSYENLRNKNVISRSSPVFLSDLILGSIAERVRHAFSSSEFGIGYQGDFPNIINRANFSLLRSYQTACSRAIAEYAEASDIPAALAGQLKAAAEEGLPFRVQRGRFGYVSPTPSHDTTKNPIVEEIRDLLRDIDITRSRLSNEHPQLKGFLDKYYQEISKNKPDVMKLFIYGGDIQTYVNRFSGGADNGEIPEIDARSLSVIDIFTVRHNALLSTTHEILKVAQQYELIAGLGGDHIREAIIPAVSAVEKASRVFDEPTRTLALEAAKRQNSREGDGPKAAAAVAIARGSLAAIGMAVTEGARDGIKEVSKEEVAEFLRDPELRDATKQFVLSNSEGLLKLAQKIPAAFGWLQAVWRLVTQSQ